MGTNATSVIDAPVDVVRHVRKKVTDVECEFVSG
jgi:hypothetical protein